MGKKKVKQVSCKGSHSKKFRATGGKNAGNNSANGKGQEGEAVIYGVVPSEYNIQAQINWLTAPPSSNDKKNPNVTQPPPSKKPQRGFHRDVCEACGEGECLMYCDKCPAAYHAICDDPPLPPEDFESIGVNWKCKKCRLSVLKFECEYPLEEENSPESEAEVSTVNKFFGSCLPQLQVQNPVQFKLPKEMPAYDYPFPGTSRHMLKKGRFRTGVIEAENGVVPKPVTYCYHCQRSARVGALIQCDKCDLFFHLDCVDPPLTTIPATVWLCPLHAEPYLESTQLTSIALSERVKIWDNMRNPVNRNAVILDFLRKGSRRNPMFRRKRPLPLTPSAEIPPLVQVSYKKCLPYNPDKFGGLNTLAGACVMETSRLDVIKAVDKYREKIFMKYLPAAKTIIEKRAKLECLKFKASLKLKEFEDTKKEMDRQEEVKINCALPSTSAQSSFATYTKALSDEQKLHALMLLAEECTKHQLITLEKEKSNNHVEPKSKKVESLKGNTTSSTPSTSKSCSELATKNAGSRNADVETCLKEVRDLDQQLSLHDDINANVYAGPSPNLKYLVEAVKNSIGVNTDPVTVSTIPSSSQPSQAPVVPRKSQPGADAAPSRQLDIVKTLPRKMVNRLAAKQLKKLRRKLAYKERQKSNGQVHQIASNLHPPTSTQPTIVFLIENTGKVVEIRQSSVWIGSDADNDWKLTDFVKCNRINKKHAKMFYNSHSACWEILNYSADGIYVNDILFGFKTMDCAPVGCNAASTERLLELHELTSKRLDDFILNNCGEFMPIDRDKCCCKPYPISLPNVFEGSAKLDIGYRLRIGCANLFIRSIIA